MAYRLGTDDEPKNCGPNNRVLGLLFFYQTDRQTTTETQVRKAGRRIMNHEGDERFSTTTTIR